MIQISLILEKELNELKKLIGSYDEDNYPKINRFGLPIFEKDVLLQKFEYIESLFHVNVKRKPDKALEKLV
eukprot:CAMPEP_0170458640 /NCGR_PEP_ID=MMETSP0123-20130129/5552_1 /TAXON_ID=182087 /ORGANISM="Favella ehrenbergii, Strain Fehren 1" /LENGTH=70 /DNA_ID=CAMNT_0010722875 /DNA_START=309 /DNA_END=521 /DNA_ORIENTATION=+